MYKFVLLAKCFLINETKMLKLGVVLIEDQGKYRICDKRQNIIHLCDCNQVNFTKPNNGHDLVYNRTYIYIYIHIIIQ